ncbi:hypothetical protein AB0N09_07470 [Streptomyces erythrochromogenes]|uniref:hypothetical protein n=1 Tax=Streptomyces erythrochromogenes TaxID=285574 RepID=UPI0034247BD8
MPIACAICGNPVGRKKLVVIKGGRSAHRACRPLTGGRAAAAPATVPAPAGKPRKQKPMSRTELLRRIQELRARDAKRKPPATKDRAAARSTPTSPQPKAAAKTRAGTKGKAAPRPQPTADRGAVTSPPYYGVEMKSIDGRWVQMHPESE